MTFPRVCRIIIPSIDHADSPAQTRHLTDLTLVQGQAKTEANKEGLMSVRILFRAILLTALLLLAARPDLVRSSQSGEPRAPIAASASPGADAPWFVDEIDTVGDTGQHASVAYHEDLGVILVSYYDATNQRLRLARSDGLPPEDCGLYEDWGCMTLDSGPDVGTYSSIDVNPVTGGIGVAYYDATNGHLKYIVFENPHLLVHQTYTIDKGITDVSWTGLYPSLKYSEDGKPHIAYHFENPSGVDALMLAYHTVVGNCGYGAIENTWSCYTLISGEGVGQYPSLIATTAPWGWAWYISFYNASSGDLWYARPVVDPPGNCGIYGDDMACYPVAVDNDVGRYSSLYVDSAGDFHIAYYDATAKKLMYAVELASGTGNCGLLASARCDVIDSMMAHYHPVGISIAEDPGGYPAIAYQGADESLKLARPLAALGLPGGSGNCGPEDPWALWSCETIDAPYWGSDYRNGDFVSLNIAPSGLAQIAYNGFILSSGGNLYIAYQRFRLVYLPLILRNY